MDCTITTTKQALTRGIALVEMMMSLGVGGLVLSAVASQMFYGGRSFAALANYVDFNRLGRARQASGISGRSGERIMSSGKGSPASI